jgi:hypothetical protein
LRFLALPRRHSYLAAGSVLLAGCPSPGPAPAGRFAEAPVAEFRTAAGQTMVRGYELLRLRWRTDDGSIAVSGSGAARLAPDSFRLDMAVQLGVGRVTVIVAGDAVQAEPAGLVERMLPDRFVLWAVLGVMKAPDSITAVARMSDGDRTFWRVTDGLSRETVFELRGGVLAGARRSNLGRDVARLELLRDGQGQLIRARVTDLVRGGRFEVDIVSRQASGPFDPSVWRLRP